MTAIDHCLQRFALLDRADDLLSEVRIYGTGLPVREILDQHRALLHEARSHLERAQALAPAT